MRSPNKRGPPGLQAIQVAGKGAYWREDVAKEAVVAAAEAVVACGVEMRRAAALADHFYRASLAFAAQTFLLTERQLHRGVDRGGERLLIEAAQPMFGVDQVVAGVELSVGLHHRGCCRSGRCARSCRWYE